jgi:acyl dehydratase
MLTLGQVFTHTFSFSQEEVVQFAEISGDKNPIHLDAVYAATTPFKKPIIHGVLTMSIFSKYFGTVWPGEGTIYLKQTIEFLRPTFVGSAYEAQMTIKEIDQKRNIAIINCKIVDNVTKKTCLTGEATLMHKEKIK